MMSVAVHRSTLSNTIRRSSLSLANGRPLSGRRSIARQDADRRWLSSSASRPTQQRLTLPRGQQGRLAWTSSQAASSSSIGQRHFHASPPSQDGKARIVDYLLADVGEGITECEIVKWFVEPGSHVEEFDVLVEVQSDKASVEITSRYTGTVKEHCYAVGQVARVGSPLCRIELEAKEGEEGATDNEQVEASKDPSSSVGSDAPAEASVQDGGEAKASVGKETDSVRQADDAKPGLDRHRTLATPSVRRISREHGVNIADIQGSGRDGRVMKEDVQAFVDKRRTAGEAKPDANRGSLDTARGVSSVGVGSSLSAANVETIPLAGVRKAMFRGMSATWSAPHFGYSDEIDVTRLEAIRKQISKEMLADHSARHADQAQPPITKLTLLPFLLKSLSLALDRHPIFRCTLDAQAMTLKQTDQHRVSIAFATPKGLLTPTLGGDVRQLSVLDIARQIATLQQNGAQRGLTQEELGSGATITLSNIGSIGGTHTFPLLPPTGQLIIGAVGRTRSLPRFDEHDNVVKATILPVSFSADHRVVEGVELAQFVSDWKRLLESPTSWLLSLR